MTALGLKARRGKAIITRMLGAPTAAALEKAGSSGEFGSALAASALEFAYGEAWADERLPLREKSLVVVAALIATEQKRELGNHVGLGVANGLGAVTFESMMIRLAGSIGFAPVMRAVPPVRAALSRAGGLPVSPPFGSRLRAARHPSGDQAAAAAEGLSARDQCLAVIAAYIATRRVSGLKDQVALGAAHGLDAPALEGILVQLVPYLGYPTVSTALAAMRDVLQGSTGT